MSKTQCPLSYIFGHSKQRLMVSVMGNMTNKNGHYDPQLFIYVGTKV